MRRFIRTPAVHQHIKKHNLKRLSKSPGHGAEGNKLLFPSMVSSDIRKNIQRTPSDLLPQLGEFEKTFLELVNVGDVDDVAIFLEHHEHLNLNCQNYQGYTCLNVAIRKGDVEMVTFLLQFENLIIGDALLHSIEVDSEEITLLILERMRDTDPTLACSWDSAHFPADLTPIMLAAHQESYKLVKLLLEWGFMVERPHPPSCFCRKKCESRKHGESLVEARIRYNSYKALASPAYICQTAEDPIYTSFELSYELRQCAAVEKELQTEYLALSKQCSQFAVDLLAECRTTRDVLMILHKRHGCASYNVEKFSRLNFALDTDQKNFVAHPNCQQVLRSVWLNEWQDWQRLGLMAKLMRLLPRIILLPLMAIVYYIVPQSFFVKSWRCPLNKFVSYAASYLIFLMILLLQNTVDTDRSERGPPNTGFEWFIVIYIFGLWWRNAKLFWRNGVHIYCKENWNIYDIVTALLFTGTFACWAWAAYDVSVNKNISLPREYWSQFDPTLVGECFYSVAILFAFGKLMYFFQIGNYLGPLQVSMGRMLKDIAHFLMVFILMMASFAISLHKLYNHYEGQVRTQGGETVRQSNAFVSVPMALHTLYWAIYGYSPPNYADVVTAEHYITVNDTTVTVINDHTLTSWVGNAMYAMYYIIGIIVLVNILIAMLSTSFSLVQGNADIEWKFARTQVWVGFFEDGNTMPPPFNLIPTPKTIYYFALWLAQAANGGKRAKWSCQRCCYLEKEDLFDIDDESYQVLMGQLVQRYFNTCVKEREDETTMVKNELHQLRSRMRRLKSIRMSNAELDTTGQTVWHETHSHRMQSVVSEPSGPL